jgi:signal transduction histidine kinase
MATSRPGSIRICWAGSCGTARERGQPHAARQPRHAQQQAQRGSRLEFTVEDNGPGIDVHDLPLIFEKFYRGKRGTSRRKGSGMGLAITRAILVAHGGGIEATNVTGSGARFRFWVPLIEKEPSRQ